jgi:methionyl-tRNA formyltransferase
MNILFCGARTAGYECLNYLLEKGENIVAVLTLDDTKDTKWAQSVLELARSKGLKTFTQKNLNELTETIRNLNPEVLFSVYYDRIIPAEILNMCRISINFHGGKLPEYRGSFSNIWAIFNGEKRSAASAHIMEETLDSGDILGVREVDVSDQDTGKSLYFKISDAAIALFKDVYRKLKENTLERTPQEKQGQTYRRKLPHDGTIDWTWEPDKIHRFIRALNFPPFVPAKTMKDGRTMYVYESKIEDGRIILTDVRDAIQ